MTNPQQGIEIDKKSKKKGKAKNPDHIKVKIYKNVI